MIKHFKQNKQFKKMKNIHKMKLECKFKHNSACSKSEMTGLTRQDSLNKKRQIKKVMTVLVKYNGSTNKNDSLKKLT